MSVLAKVKQLLVGQSSWKGVLLRLILTSLVLLCAYVIYLDGKMKLTFAQMIQTQPIEIQARALSLKAGLPISKSELKAELLALNYTKVAHLTKAGQFTESNSKLEIYLGSDAHSIPQHERRVLVRFDGALIDSMQSPFGRPVSSIELPAVVISKLWPGKREERLPVKLAEVPPSLVELLLWVEDRDFYDHFGVNPVAIGRALLVNLSAGRTVQGGSTLTQQLAKNLLLTRERSLTRKINEALLSVLMEWHFSKDQILQAYINEVYLGQRGAVAIHGFASASKFYFGKPLSKLSLEQQVMLVAMVKGPSLYHPWRHPDKLLARRDLLLRSLLEQEKITTEQYLGATDAGLGVLSKGLVQHRQRPAIASVVKQELKQRAGWQLSDGVLSVQTTIVPHSQQSIEASVVKVLPELERRYQVENLQVAMLAVDTQSGAVRAMLSDRNPSYPGFNRAVAAKRPIGSLLKPFILLTALQELPEMTLASQLNDRPVSMVSEKGKRWQPQNFDRKYQGNVSAQEALSRSLNVPFVNLGMTIGLESIQAELEKVSGYSFAALYPSDLLGSISLTPWQVAQLYRPLVDQGVQQPLFMLNVIQSKRAAFELMEPTAEQKVEPQFSYLLQYALSEVVQQGTAKRLKGAFPGVTLAGKTGSTNDLRDSWFVGIDGLELVVIWIGRDDNESIQLTGSKAALALYREYLTQRGPASFTTLPPTSIEFADFDGSGRAVEPGCPAQYHLPARKTQLQTLRGCQSQVKKESNSTPWWKRVVH